MSQKAVLKMTAGDSDSFIATIVGVDLSAATFVRYILERPSGTLTVDHTDIGDLTDGKFQIDFSGTDLEPGPMQRGKFKWSIAGKPKTSEAELFIDVDEDPAA